MIAHVLLGCGMDPGYLIGGELRYDGRATPTGATGEWLVVEADESDRSMLCARTPTSRSSRTSSSTTTRRTARSPRSSEAFRAFLARRRRRWSGTAPTLRRAAADGRVGRLRRRRRGSSRRLDVRVARAATVGWRCPASTTRATPPRRSRPCALAGADARGPSPRWRDFAGAGRRFEGLGDDRSGRARRRRLRPSPDARSRRRSTPPARWTPQRVVAVFQPHLYSRTQRLAREFGAALARADVAVVLDVYPARERAEDFPGVSGLLVAEAAADAAAGRTVLVAAGLRRRRARARRAAAQRRPVPRARGRRHRRPGAPARRLKSPDARAPWRAR